MDPSDPWSSSADPWGAPASSSAQPSHPLPDAQSSHPPQPRGFLPADEPSWGHEPSDSSLDASSPRSSLPTWSTPSVQWPSAALDSDADAGWGMSLEADFAPTGREFVALDLPFPNSHTTIVLDPFPVSDNPEQSETPSHTPTLSQPNEEPASLLSLSPVSISSRPASPITHHSDEDLTSTTTYPTFQSPPDVDVQLPSLSQVPPSASYEDDFGGFTSPHLDVEASEGDDPWGSFTDRPSHSVMPASDNSDEGDGWEASKAVVSGLAEGEDGDEWGAVARDKERDMELDGTSGSQEIKQDEWENARRLAEKRHARAVS